MAIIIGLLLTFGLSYAMYLHGQRIGAKNYILAGINLVFPFIGIIFGISLLVRKIKGAPQPKSQLITYAPPGFRSRTKWKIAVASVTYLVLGGFVAVASAGVANPTANQAAATSTTVSKAQIESKQPGTPAKTNIAVPAAASAANKTAKHSGTLKVSFINVGEGDSALIQTPNGVNVLIDGGRNEETATVENYLRSAGVAKLDYVIATHEDADHIGSLDAVIRDFTIGKVYMPKMPPKNTRTFEAFLAAVQSKGLKFNQAKAGVALDLGTGVQAVFVGPVKGSYQIENDYSAVLHLKYGAISFLFTGDAEAAAENDMIASGQDIQSTVLKVGHHGSRYSTSNLFLDKVAPKYAVISVGPNDYGHPTGDVLSRLSEHGVQVYRTDEAGTVVATTDGAKISFNANPSDTLGAPTPGVSAPSKRNANISPAPVRPTAPVGQLSATAEISNPSPTHYATETVTVSVKAGGTPVSGASVTITAHYKTKDSTYSGTTGSDGVATIPFRIGRASKGFTVTVDVVATANGSSANASTSFTPQ